MGSGRITRTGRDDLGLSGMKVRSFQSQSLSGCISTGERVWVVADKMKRGGNLPKEGYNGQGKADGQGRADDGQEELMIDRKG